VPPPAASPKPHEPDKLFNQNTAGAACNIPVCERAYRSFRASDCTYQPDAGGPRRFCDRQSGTTAATSGGNERAAAAPADTDRADAARRTRAAQQSRAAEQNPTGRDTEKNDEQQTAHAAPGSANGACNVAACRGYGSFRASDCTYQPFGGGPRRVCGRQNGGQDERTAGRPRRERDAERTAGRAGRERDGGGPYYDDSRDESFAQSPGRDGPFGRSPPGGFFGLPLFNRGNDGW
jgi:hypothetical protein